MEASGKDTFKLRLVLEDAGAGFHFLIQTVYLAAPHAFVVGYAFRISIAHGNRDIT